MPTQMNECEGRDGKKGKERHKDNQEMERQ